MLWKDDGVRARAPGGWRGGLEILQQPFDVIELKLRAETFTETLAQFFQNTPRTLHVDFARYFDCRIVTIVTPAQRPPERIGPLIRAPLRPVAWLAGSHSIALLLHRLRQLLCAFAQGFKRASLRIYRAVGISFTE